MNGRDIVFQEIVNLPGITLWQIFAWMAFELAQMSSFDRYFP